MIAFNTSIVAAMYLAMQGSQAVKVALIEDLLAFVPPAAFLIADRFARRRPDQSFPYGYHKANSIAYLTGAVALALFGGFLLYDSVSLLLSGEEPDIGEVELFGGAFWAGWLMIAALLYSAVPPFVLGRRELEIAQELREETLLAGARMNRANWITAVAAMVGVGGIGIGWWWLDGIAATLIAADVIRDGIGNVKDVVRELMDGFPTAIDGKEETELAERMVQALAQLDWVEQAAVRLREEGHVISGELFVVPRDGRVDVHRLDEAKRTAQAIDWRLYEPVVVPVAALDADEGA